MGLSPTRGSFFFEKYCLGRVVLCCFVFLLCCVALPFFLSISWIIKKSCMCGSAHDSGCMVDGSGGTVALDTIEMVEISNM